MSNLTKKEMYVINNSLEVVSLTLKEIAEGEGGLNQEGLVRVAKIMADDREDQIIKNRLKIDAMYQENVRLSAEIRTLTTIMWNGKKILAKRERIRRIT